MKNHLIKLQKKCVKNGKVLKRNYLKFFITNFIVVLLFLLPGGGAYLIGKIIASNEVFSSTTVLLVSALAFCVLSGPFATIKQLHYVYAYKSLSRPFKEDFDNELKNVIKDIEELQKITDKIEEK